jgi:hypothetical protein
MFERLFDTWTTPRLKSCDLDSGRTRVAIFVIYLVNQINDLSFDSEQNDLWLIDLDLHEMTCYQRKSNV